MALGRVGRSPPVTVNMRRLAIHEEYGKLTTECVRVGEDAKTEGSLAGLNVDELNTEQRRAYNIVIWHTRQTLSGATEIPSLMMAVHREGGTG